MPHNDNNCNSLHSCMKTYQNCSTQHHLFSVWSNSLSTPSSVSTSCLFWKGHQMIWRWYKHDWNQFNQRDCAHWYMRRATVVTYRKLWERLVLPECFSFILQWDDVVKKQDLSRQQLPELESFRKQAHSLHQPRGVPLHSVKRRDTFIPLIVASQSLCWGATVILAILPQEDLIFLAGICQKCCLKRKNLFECIFHKTLCSLKIFWSFTLNSIQTEIKPKQYLNNIFQIPMLSAFSPFFSYFLCFSNGRKAEQKTQRVWGWLSLFN